MELAIILDILNVALNIRLPIPIDFKGKLRQFSSAVSNHVCMDMEYGQSVVYLGFGCFKMEYADISTVNMHIVLLKQFFLSPLVYRHCLFFFFFFLFSGSGLNFHF